MAGIGERIKTVRGDLSREKFSAMTGISKTALVNYETESRIPSADYLVKILEQFPETSAGWLLTGEGHKCSDPRCVGSLHSHGHILAKSPPFDSEVLAHIFNELHEYKLANPDYLSKEQELDVISLASQFIQPENQVEAALIFSIVTKWARGKDKKDV